MTTASLYWILTGCSLLVAASPLESQTLEIGDRWTTLDRVVPLQARGLQPGQAATIRARSRDGARREWSASAEFTAGANGSFDLARQSPKSGSYTGVAPMGLFQLMDVAGDDRGRVRFESAWSDTIATEFALEVNGTVVARDTLHRTFTSPGVRASAIRQDGLVGIRFSPAMRPPIARVLVLGGSEGGLGSADVAAQLATHGFETLALAYFGADSLSPQLAMIPLEYFGRGLRFLEAESPGSRSPIAILGTSKGAEAALLLAVRYPIVRGVVAYAPSSVAWSCICDSAALSSWTWQGKPIPAVRPGVDPAYRPAPGSPLRPAVNYAFRMRNNASPDAVIPVEKARAKVLVIAGLDDALWPSAAMAEEIRRRAAAPGSFSSVQLLLYEFAGHLIGKSYLPSGSTLIARGRIETGGSPEGNARAQADSWPRVLEFLSSLRPR